MRTLLNTWSPWQELDQIQQEMNRLFGRRQGDGTPQFAFPPVNIWANDASLVLTAEISGMNPDDLDVTVNRNSITIRGTRAVAKPEEGQTFYRRERQGECFSRTLDLPIEVDPQSAEADYEKGVLTLRLARPNEHQPRKVNVKAL